MKFGSITTGIIADGLVFNMDAANRASTIPSTSTTITFNTVDLTESGSLVTDATWTNSTISPSFNFDGTDGEIQCSTITLANDFTISAWITNPLTDSNNDQLFSSGDAGSGFFLFSTAVRNGGANAGKMTYYNGSSLIAFTSGVRDGNWHHVSLTYDSSTTTLTGYTEGNQTYSDTYNAGTNNVIKKIGNNLYGHYWLGNIGCAQIYNRALLASEILHNYNALKSRFE